METEGNSLPSPSCPDGRKRRVCYYYDPLIANVDYGAGHSMVPRRVALTHALVDSYGLLHGHGMKRLRTRPATERELASILHKDYLALLRDLTPRNYHGQRRQDAVHRNIIGLAHHDDQSEAGDGRQQQQQDSDDNPVIAGLWDYCTRYAGGSLAAARALGSRESDIAVNWSGRTHHAYRDGASGFCYANDIVLAVRELLRAFPRVLYVDIDVHHGDDVEDQFAEESRVMAVSFHQHGHRAAGGDGAFFPGTGAAGDVGKGGGEYRTLNVPLKYGMDDAGYREMFRPIVGEVMRVFQPEAVVLQCGADSLAGDRLGEFNLSVKGHASCVAYLRSFNKPLLLLGGGGYTINHVASCWCYETAVAIGTEIPDEIPHHGYEHYYKDQDYKLHYAATRPVKNASNTKEHMANIRKEAMENLEKLKSLQLEAAPSVQFKDRTAGSINFSNLYGCRKRDREYLEEDDPIKRLYRLCGKADLVDFFTQVGREHIKSNAITRKR